MTVSPTEVNASVAWDERTGGNIKNRFSTISPGKQFISNNPISSFLTPIYTLFGSTNRGEEGPSLQNKGDDAGH